MTTDDLFLGQLSLFGLSHGERCRAAAAAGFSGVSLFWKDVLERRAAGGGDSELRAEAEAHGLRIVQLEFAPLTARDRAAEFAELAAAMAESAAALGCEAVHAVALDPASTEDDQVTGMAALADACAAQGLRCGLEFVPFVSACADLPAALRVIRAAGRANAGLVLDALHFFRGGAQWDALETLRPGEVVTLQINDGTRARPTLDYNEEAMALRLPPGKGELDLARLLAVLRGRGIALPLTVEAPNRRLDALDPLDAARRLADSARALLQSTAPAAQGISR
jgi:sugar phosphate isomerase/epimerase